MTDSFRGLLGKLGKFNTLKTLGKAEYHPLWLVLISTLSSIGLYVPLYLKDPSLLFRHWDGPNYLYVARTLYQIPVDHPFVSYKTTQAYFACHLPLYPLLIRLFSYLFDYPAAMLFVTLLSSAAATYLFYLLIKETEIVAQPFWSAVLFLFLPIRWLTYHSLGATEPLFLALVFGSMLLWRREKYALAFLLVGLSSVTRIVGVLVGVAYFCTAIHQKRWKSIPLMAIMPLPLLLTFGFYAYQFGDFWAYFSWNAKLLNPMPLKVFLAYASTNNPHHAELYLMMYFLYGAGTLMLWRKPLFFWYSAVFWVFNLFVFHEDLSRYYLPITPFVLIIAYDKVLSRRAMQLMFPFLLFGVYAYSLPLIEQNALVDWVWPRLQEALRH